MSTSEKKNPKACLICSKVVTLRKGLCPSHYAQYSRSREIAIAKGVDPDLFDAELVKQNLLAEDSRQATNPFAKTLEKMLASERTADAEAKVSQSRRKKE